jgi:hypothetical protein
MLPELVALQQKTNAAFQPPRSVEFHSRFIALNSTLKLAQELDARKFYAGSLYQYLEAVRHYAMLDAPQVDPARQKALQISSRANKESWLRQQTTFLSRNSSWSAPRLKWCMPMVRHLVPTSGEAHR